MGPCLPVHNLRCCDLDFECTESKEIKMNLNRCSYELKSSILLYSPMTEFGALLLLRSECQAAAEFVAVAAGFFPEALAQTETKKNRIHAASMLVL